MPTRIRDTAPGKVTVSAGVLYLILIISGIFAEFFVRSNLIVPGNVVITAENITANPGLFRLGIVGDLIMISCDIALALIFYVLLKQVNQAFSMMAAFFRLIQASILGVNLLALFFILEILTGDALKSAFNAEQLQGLTLLFASIHGTGYAVGLVFFAISLFILGYLIYRSGFIPSVLGLLLFVAALGYLFDSFARVLLLNYADYESLFSMIVFAPAFIAELSLCTWLISRGSKIKLAAQF